MVNDQFDPLKQCEGDKQIPLGDTLRYVINYYSFLKRIINNNKVIVPPEDLGKKLLRMLLNVDGERFLGYLEKYKAYTVNVAATHLGVSEKKVHSYTGALVKTGFLCVSYKVRSGERGSPVNVYMISGEDDQYAKEAANLYHDLHATYKPEPLESYMRDYDYIQIAEEAAKKLAQDGAVGTWGLLRLLSDRNLYSDEALIQVRRNLRSMGFMIREGE